MAAVARLRSADGREFASDRNDLLELIRERSFKTGDFTLSSGVKSSLYFNMKPTMMDPRGAELSARVMLDVVRNLNPDYVSGLEMGAVPVIGALAAVSQIEERPIATTFVRKQPKAHGTRDWIEGLAPGESLLGKTVLVLDDVATSGKSFMIAIERIRQAGGKVTDAACLVNREEGAEALLKENSVTLHSVFRGKDFIVEN
jgi:orotate phosphoribosyltransferase